jgi:hypothetical protein
MEEHVGFSLCSLKAPEANRNKLYLLLFFNTDSDHSYMVVISCSTE